MELVSEMPRSYHARSQNRGEKRKTENSSSSSGRMPKACLYINSNGWRHSNSLWPCSMHFLPRMATGKAWGLIRETYWYLNRLPRHGFKKPANSGNELVWGIPTLQAPSICFLVEAGTRLTGDFVLLDLRYLLINALIFKNFRFNWKN